MKGLNWSLLAALVVLLCHYTTAAPSLRIKRQDELTLDPINVDVSIIIGYFVTKPKPKQKTKRSFIRSIKKSSIRDC